MSATGDAVAVILDAVAVLLDAVAVVLDAVAMVGAAWRGGSRKRGRWEVGTRARAADNVAVGDQRTSAELLAWVAPLAFVAP